MKIAILDDYQGAARTHADWSEIDRRAEVVTFNDHLADFEALVERLNPFDAIHIMRERTPIDAALLERLPHLKYIGSNAPHNAGIDLAAARSREITVTYTDGVGNGAPEMTWALIFAAARHIPAEVAAVRSGGWQLSVGCDLEGSTLGIMGLGKIGQRVAAVGNALGMRVIAWSQNLTSEAATAAGVRRVDKSTLIEEADWLSLHLILSDRSRGVIGAEELQRMKRSAWLVNTSRGPLVDEAALIEALETRRIAGAALDVFDQEPLPQNHPFRTFGNVISTPHIGYVTHDTYRLFYRQAVENLVAWLDGAPIRQMP